MSNIIVNKNSLLAHSSELKDIGSRLAQVQSEVLSVRSAISIHMSSSGMIKSHLRDLASQIGDQKNKVSNMSQVADSIANTYFRAENDIRGKFVPRKENHIFIEKGSINVHDTVGLNENKWDIFKKEFLSEFDWSDILRGSGYIGDIYGFVNNIRNGKSWSDFIKSGMDICEFLSGAAKKFRDYKKIGNAVGGKKAMAWWARSITGLKPLGRASTAKNPFTRFANNLTNKTSPFNAQFKDVIKTFKGGNGIGKAVASWGAVAANGVFNWFSNKEEQANSNGMMSEGRVWAETITETAVDTAMTYGAGIVIGAAVTTVIGPIAAPGIVVAAAGGLAVTAINAGVKALTGKTTTEWISDTVLDTGEAIAKTVSNAAKNVKEAIGGWFGKLAFT